MLDQLRARMAAFLAAHEVGLLSTSGARGAWAMPVRYHSHGLAVDCLIPCWADVAYFVEQDPHVLLVIVDGPPSLPVACGGEGQGGLRWLQIAGTASPIPDPDWAHWLPDRASPLPPAEVYLLLRVTPARIELFDESRGWGAREGLEL